MPKFSIKGIFLSDLLSTTDLFYPENHILEYRLCPTGIEYQKKILKELKGYVTN